MTILPKYFPNLSPDQLSLFAQLNELYIYWNARINLISRKDIKNLFERHILHSLGVAKIIQFRDDEKIMDAGTGGGFPGIPLAILFPEAQFYLVDSIGKKIKAVREIIKELGLKNIDAKQLRIEQVSEKFNFIVGRAVTTLPNFFKLVCNKMTSSSPFGDGEKGGEVFYLTGGDITTDLSLLKKNFPHSAVKIYQLSDYFSEPFFRTKKIVHIKKVCNL